MFKDKKEVQDLVQRAENAKETKRLTSKFKELKKGRHPFYLTLIELKEILEWKLRKQIGRQIEIRRANTNENIIAITTAVFAVKHKDKDFETKLKLMLLKTIAGIEVPVASAILTLCFPKLYSVIDFRNWQQIYKPIKRKTSYTTNDYIKYLKKIRKWAVEIGVTPQAIDIAIWQKYLEKSVT